MSRTIKQQYINFLSSTDIRYACQHTVRWRARLSHHCAMLRIYELNLKQSRNNEENEYGWTLSANERSVSWFLANIITIRHDYSPHGTNLVNSLGFPPVFTSTDIKYPNVKSKQDNYVTPSPFLNHTSVCATEFEIKFAFYNKVFFQHLQKHLFATCVWQRDQVRCTVLSEAMLQPCRCFTIVVICEPSTQHSGNFMVHSWIS